MMIKKYMKGGGMKKTRKAITREIFDQVRELLPFVPAPKIAKIVGIGGSTIYTIKKYKTHEEYAQAGRQRYEKFNGVKKANQAPKKLGRPKKVIAPTNPAFDMTDTYLTKSFEMMVRQTEATEALVNATKELVAAWRETPRH